MFETTTVAEWMNKPVITVMPKTRLVEAHRMMKENLIRRLPVIDKDAKVVGILTIGDIREAAPSDATTLSIWELNYLQSQITVEQVMTRNPIQVTADLSILDAAQLMLEHKVSGLPVVDKETRRIVGILTESDIFRMLVQTRQKQV